MPTPTILIGVGTSGLAALDHAQRYYQEATNGPLPAHVAMVYLETNKNSEVGITYHEDIIKGVYLDLNQLDLMAKRLREGFPSTGAWLPPMNQVSHAGMGAAGIRPCGRLALWGSNGDRDNFKEVIQTIRNASQKVSNIHQDGDVINRRPIVIITGSMTGGTGSGCFIDLAYLVRDVMPNVERVFGLFLLPRKPDRISGEEMKYANSYGALRDLDYMNQPGHVYMENWPNGRDVSLDTPPFDLAQFISGDHRDGSQAIQTSSGLFKMAGLYLSLNILGGKVGNEYHCLYEKRMERLVDAAGNSLLGKFGTFGLSAIQFPKEQIEEFIACNLSEDLILRWIDEKNYVENNRETNILKDKIRDQVFTEFNQMINLAFEALYTYGDRNLAQRLSDEALRIAEKDIDDDEAHYIHKLFSSRSQTGIYGPVANNLISASNYLVEEIQKYVAARLNESENLEIARLSLDYFVAAILDCQELWSSYGIKSDTQIWEKWLSEESVRITKNTYAYVFEKTAVLKDRLMTLFHRMIMHLLTKELTRIRKAMESESDPYVSTINRVQLPSVAFFNNIKTWLGGMVREGTLQQAQYNFEKRKKQILSDIGDIASTIRRVYPTNFDDECARGQKQYYQKLNKIRPSKADLRDQNTGQEVGDLYAYFKGIEKASFEKRIYSDLIHSYKATVNHQHCVSDYDILQYVRMHQQETKSMAERALRLLLATNDDSPPSDYLPKMIIANDDAEITEVIRILRQQCNYNEFEERPDHRLSVPTLRNMLIFFHEKGNFNPLHHLPYIEQMKKTFVHKPDSIKEAITDETWRAQRSAYIPLNVKE